MTKFCTNCGTECVDDAKFCINCGNSFDDSSIPENSGSSALGCFICNKPMVVRVEDGFLGGTFHVCDACGIKVKQMKYGSEQEYSLHKSPANTRLHQKYSYSSMSLDQWKTILNNGLSKDEIEEYGSYEQEGVSHYNCPFCSINFTKYKKKSFLTSMTLYICDNCKLTFQKVDDKFRFLNYTGENPKLWENFEKKYTRNVWEDILEVSFVTESRVVSQETDDAQDKTLDDVARQESDAEGQSVTDEIVKIDLNRADADEISELPVFNLIQAKKIVQLRESGNFINSFDDLKEKLNLSDSDIEKLRDYIIINPVVDSQDKRIVDI